MRIRSGLPVFAALASSVALGFGLNALARATLEATAGPEITIVRHDQRFDELVPQDAVVEQVVEGYAWVEGPVWNRTRGFLLFSEIPSNSIYKWEEGKGASLFLRPSGYTGTTPFPGPEPGSNGLTFDLSGRLVLCEHGDRSIARLEAGGQKTTLVDRYEGKRINSPNDLVYKSNGDLYFTDPPFGLPKGMEDPGKELAFQGVYRLSKDGRLTLLTREVKFPNGIGFSPDEKTLYISNADRGNAVWLAFDVKSDGTLGKSRILFDGTAWTKAGKGVPDGLKVDRNGNIFAAGPGGLHVFAPDGSHLGSIQTSAATSNSAWGGDGSVLYLTISSGIYRIRLNTKGAGW